MCEFIHHLYLLIPFLNFFYRMKPVYKHPPPLLHMADEQALANRTPCDSASSASKYLCSPWTTRLLTVPIIKDGY